MSFLSNLKESPITILNIGIFVFFLLFVIGAVLKKKANGKPQSSSEYKSYQTFKVIMIIIFVIIAIVAGGMFGPELFSAGLAGLN